MGTEAGHGAATVEAMALAVRVFAVGIFGVSVLLLFVTVDQNLATGSQLVPLASVGLGLHAAIAMLPWRRLLRTATGPWLVRVYVIGNVATVWLARRTLEQLPWPVLLLPALTLILTAAVLTIADHLIATGLLVALLVFDGRSSIDALSLTVLVAVVVLGSMSWELAATSLRRTWALIDAERTRADKEAQRLRDVEERREQALAMVVHEIKNRVSVILGATETLSHRAAALTTEQIAGMAAAACTHADGVRRTVQAVELLATMDRLDRTRLTAVSIADVAHVVVDDVRARAGGHDLVVDAPPELRARTDPVLLERVLMNLVSNAVRHTPQGSTVTVTARDEDVHQVRVSVADDGPGIPVQDRDRITEPFYRAAGTTAQEDELGIGMGLGLALVVRALDAQGSRLEIDEPATGTGAVFSFLLEGTDT